MKFSLRKILIIQVIIAIVCSGIRDIKFDWLGTNKLSFATYLFPRGEKWHSINRFGVVREGQYWFIGIRHNDRWSGLEQHGILPVRIRHDRQNIIKVGINNA